MTTEQQKRRAWPDPRLTMASELSPAAVQFLGSEASGPQVKHRLEILRKWQIPRGSKVLEIGCGQGDCTILLADLVGEKGHVTAIDPAPLDYGAPMTLGETQAQLKSSPLGDRITFKRTTLEELCRSDVDIYDYAVFVHSVWYLPLPEMLSFMLLSLRGRARQLLIAEYSLELQGDVATLPHMLAAISQADLNSHQVRDSWVDMDNIQATFSAKMICEMARKAGWELEMDSTIQATEGLQDGRWEVSHVLSEKYASRVDSLSSESRRAYAKMLLHAVEQSVAAQPWASMKTLPTWLSSWKLKSSCETGPSDAV